jgi:hypothetical protein
MKLHHTPPSASVVPPLRAASAVWSLRRTCVSAARLPGRPTGRSLF